MTPDPTSTYRGTRFFWIGMGTAENTSMSVVDRENIAALRSLGWEQCADANSADVVISFHHQDHPGVEPDRSGRLRLFYLCNTCHNALISDYVERFRRVADAPGNYIFVLNRALQAGFAAAGIDTHVWNHGVNLDVFCPRPRAVAAPVVFGFVGQGEAFKRHEFLVQCFVDAFADDPGRARLLLMTGWGHIPGFSRIPDNVVLATAHRHSDMADFYDSLDCLVTFSSAEGYNLPPLEALACGVPCIVTDMPEMHEPPYDNLCRHVRAERVLKTDWFIDTPFATRDARRYHAPPWVHRVSKEDGICALREFAAAPLPRRMDSLSRDYSWAGCIRRQLLPVIGAELVQRRSGSSRPAVRAAALPANTQPGCARPDRISQEGLQRLERQLQSGARMSTQVLEQWLQRYGDAARALIERYRHRR